MKHKVVIAGLVLILLVISLAGSKVISTLAAPDGRASGSALSQESPADAAIQEAFQQAVAASREQQGLLAAMIYDIYIDEMFYSNDGLTALLWLGMRDIETGEVIAAEPGISIARIQNRFASAARAESWQITLPADQEWYDQLKSLPEELLTEDIKNRFLQPGTEEAFEAAASTVYTGYKLPWAAGLSKRITQSIGHYLQVSGGWTSCPATCQFAYDFADGTMFPIVAAKGGTVKAFKTTCANGNSSCTNYLILEDQSTTPTTYQVYYHMAYNSIPQHLRVLGARVVQGEYIGDADDTGASTGHHLHYHIYISPNTADWSWGKSVDFVFDDVIQIYGSGHNGGRPRTCAEAAQYPHLGNRCNDRNFYVSGNTPANPPSGSLDTKDHQVITTPTVKVSGIAMDDIQITRILVLVNHNGTWRQIDSLSTNETGLYEKEVDLCAANVPDGPFAMTVEIYDREGSLAPGLPVVQLIKNVSCSTPAKKQPASVKLLYPKKGEKIPSGPFDIVVDAVDFDGQAVKQVEFFWHSGDWSKHTWVKLGVDRDGSDGWQMTVDPMDHGKISGSAVYVQALSKDGGVLGKVLWNLEADPVKPVSRLNPISGTIDSTAVLLTWRASDPNDDLDHFEIEHKVGDGNWQPLTDRRISGDARSAWVIAVPGAVNSYRLRAVDRQGNVESFDNKPVVTVTVPGTCTPSNESSGQTQSNAVLIEKDKPSPTFNFCSSSTVDVDWIRVSAPKGRKVSLAVYPISGSGAGFTLSLYDSANKLVQTSKSPDLGQAAGIFWTPPTAGNYYLKIEPLYPGLFGTSTGYYVLFADAVDTYLPGIYR